MVFNHLNRKCQIDPFLRRNVMKKLLTISLAVLLIFAGVAPAACPSADVSGDCRVNLDDFAIMASEWLTTYDPNDLNDLADMASQWLDDGVFVTTWDTSLGAGTTVTLALAGTVDATTLLSTGGTALLKP